ncbi:hypothetical protein O9G_000482 [Rozella allomycis CSF55]|uniref:Uncharacterized protein n=1 Tax=Rozella allomycis (strain CSF55) TaxID=988480 RepID=A0A075ATT6_ROZAC|nr:hypothetical protein O9G_000482 [Rozella allomycis CSF55]|eukprot:EPZ33706.1 hypothetical protein O9G_000482 [Rozella allomycis CSF55]
MCEFSQWILKTKILREKAARYANGNTRVQVPVFTTTRSSKVYSLIISISQLEHENSSLKIKNNEFEAQIKALQSEKRDLLFGVQEWKEKYSNVKRSAAQLENFRKSILSVVEFGTGLDSPVQEQTRLQFRDSHTNSRKSSKEDIDALNGNNRPGRKMSYVLDASILQDEQKPAIHEDDHSFQITQSYFKESQMSNNDKPLDMEQLHSRIQDSLSKSASLENVNNFESDLNNTTNKHKFGDSKTFYHDTVSIDAPTLYKKIKKIVTTEQFEKFAGIISRFNTRQLTPEATIQQITPIIPDEFLLDQMRKLVISASIQ